MRTLNLNTIKALLEEKQYTQVHTPLILNYTQAIPFMTTATQQSQVKLQGPSGEMLTLRGDSTIALVIGDVMKSFDQLDTESNVRLFYDEANFSHDFEKRVISEVRQVGVEVVEKSSTQSIGSKSSIGQTQNNTFTEAFNLAIDIAQRLCGSDIRIEVSHATGLKTVISNLVNGDEKKRDALMYYLNRKNIREAVKILCDTDLGASAKQVVERLLTMPSELDAYIAEVAPYEAFEPINQWLLNVRATSNALNFDPSLIVDKPYYTGETFVIYDTKRHMTLITGGTYRFDTYGISGCGFSIRDGGMVTI